jgi:hypothetical protein
LQFAEEAFFDELFRDTLSFAGAVMTRRVLGIAHVIDFEHIKDDETRYLTAFGWLTFPEGISDPKVALCQLVLGSNPVSSSNLSRLL